MVMHHDTAELQYNFSGHETFPFRYTWLPKGVQQLQQDAALFKRDDAIAVLGVGKNMVNAIRHWCHVTGLIDKTDDDKITELGRLLLSSRAGWDPYLEDIGTLWLLHWQITRRSSPATTWQLTFTQRSQNTFTKDQLVEWLTDLGEQSSKRVSRNTVKRDVDVFVRTYVASKATSTRPLEETFDSPLVELGLIREREESGARTSFFMPRSDQTTLPTLIFVYALLDYWTMVAAEQQSLSFDLLQYARGCPGGAFRLTDNALVARLESLPAWSGLRFDDTAGMRQLFRNDAVEPLKALERYYDALQSTAEPRKHVQ